jgi:threonine 3-dehydrogenase
MKAIIKEQPGLGAIYTDIPEPIINNHEVLIEVKAAALCKSDVDVYEWTPVVEASNLPLPRVMGHEFIGEVIETGKCIKALKAGDLVCGETHIPCGTCYCCKTGKMHICCNGMGVVGRNTDGCFAKYIKLPEISAIKMDPEMPYTHGAIMEPLGTALHALQKIDVAGRTILILGCGAIGLMSIELARFLGAGKIIAVSTSPEKLNMAQTVGADLVINGKETDMTRAVLDYTKGVGVDAALEYTGNQHIINKMIQCIKTAGTCVFVGMIDYPLTFNDFMLKVVLKEIVLTGIFGRQIHTTWEILKGILATGKLNLDNYVYTEMPLEQFEEAVELSRKAVGRIVFNQM